MDDSFWNERDIDISGTNMKVLDWGGKYENCNIIYMYRSLQYLLERLLSVLRKVFYK